MALRLLAIHLYTYLITAIINFKANYLQLVLNFLKYKTHSMITIYSRKFMTNVLAFIVDNQTVKENIINLILLFR